MAKKKKRKKKIAKTADKYRCYQLSVQEPEAEMPFFKRAWREAFGHEMKPTLLREDFCGTFAICCEWLKDSKQHRAIGVDLDPEPLNWGREHNLPGVPESRREHLKLYEDNVLKVMGEKAEILAAQNFSFWIFKERQLVLDYFKAAFANMAKRGIMIMDMMGGPELMEEDQIDRRDIEGDDNPHGKFEYQWEQKKFDPISHDVLFHIHFKFKDGSKMKKAFTYDWRMWSIPEVRDLLHEAGFKEVHVYWEGVDEDGEGNGIYKRKTSAPCDPCFIAYLVAVKK